MRHPLSLLTREVAPVPLATLGTALPLQDLHAPFSDLDEGALLREARCRVVSREFDEYAAGVSDAIANAARLLTTARELGWPVYFVLWGYRGDAGPSLLQRAIGWEWDVAGPDGRLPDALQPRRDEMVDAKPGWGAPQSETPR